MLREEGRGRGVRCLAQGHLDTQLGGARDQTNNLAVSKLTS